MYSPTVIEHRLEQARRKLDLPHLVRFSPDEIDNWNEHLNSLLAEDGPGSPPGTGGKSFIRPLNTEELQFIQNEQLLAKFDYRYAATRYHWILRDGVAGGGLGRFVPWEAQNLILDRMATAEEEALSAREAGYPVDGIKIVDYKSRQLGGTMLARSLTMHRVTLWRDQRSMAASVNEDKILELYDRDKRILENLPFYLRPDLEFDVKAAHLSVRQTNSSILYQHAQQTSGLGQGRQFEVGHLTECASFPYPRMIELDYFPTIPQSIHALVILESTAQGRNNWWHEFTEDVRNGHRRGWIYLFVPWYAEPTKYRARPPDGWIPSKVSQLHSDKVWETSPEWVGKRVRLSKEQLYWYETERAAAVKGGVLNIFFTNYCETPDVGFQHSGDSSFPPDVLERLRLGTGPGQPYEITLGQAS